MLWIILLLAILSIGLVCRLFAVKRQLKSIARELDRTAEPGYDRNITVSLFDRDVNELASALNRNIARQKQLKISTEQAELALRQSVSDIAHDLRTPLAVIKGDLQLILRDPELNGNCRGYAEICLEKTEHLKEMSDEFFELAVLESERGTVCITRLNLTNLLMGFIAEHEGMIRIAGLEPEIFLPPQTVFVLAEESLVNRILGNLLGNVLKYSHERFSLTLSEDGAVTIANPVSDHIPEPERLFERTYRSDRARNGRGAGLGLYIVKLLAEKQAAEVSAAVQNGELAVTVHFRIE